MSSEFVDEEGGPDGGAEEEDVETRMGDGEAPLAWFLFLANSSAIFGIFLMVLLLKKLLKGS